MSFTIERYYGLRSKDREEAVRHVSLYLKDLEERGVRWPGAPALRIQMPCCGKEYLYQTVEEFPEASLPCECGAEGRWVVFYEAGS